jgi:hypothetical protein
MVARPVLFGCLFLFSTVCGAGGLPATRRWQVYRSPDYGFTIAYPASLSFYPGHPDLKEVQMESMIPVCEESTVACFLYNRNHKRTNLQAAGVSVNVLRDRKTEDDCNKIDSAQYPIKTETINGIEFHSGETGEVATGNNGGGPVYRSFYHDVCFEVAVVTAWTNMSAYDSGEIKAFDSKALDKLLEKVVHTFKFVSAVRDGSGWKLYEDSECGGVFEYPEGETVRTIAEYSNASYYSHDISCSRYFTHNGLVYTVAAKVNLKESQLEPWLESSGYPGLTNARTVTKGKYFTGYSAGSYCYFYGQGTVYILGVSDANHNVILSHGDRVFAHFVNSFKAK